MNSTTRQRLLEAASRLFAAQGYRGASIRDICDLARANPGAVSYHFGGKRQLYRTVLRQGAERLTAVTGPPPARDQRPEERLEEVVRALFSRLRQDEVATRLLLRDLAEGGNVAVEALEPTLRGALEGLATVTGMTDADRVPGPARRLLLELAAPVFLLTAAWPVLARALELDPIRREEILAGMVRRVLQQRPYDADSTL